MSELKNKKSRSNEKKEISQDHETDATELEDELSEEEQSIDINERLQEGDQKSEMVRKNYEMIHKIKKKLEKSGKGLNILKIQKEEKKDVKMTSENDRENNESERSGKTNEFLINSDLKEETGESVGEESSDIKELSEEKNKIKEPREEKIDDKRNKLTSEVDIENNKSENNEKVSEKTHIITPEDIFFKEKNSIKCRDIDLLKKIYEIEKSFPKIELYLKNQDCENVPSSSTIKHLVQKSFKSKVEYKTWKHEIKLKEIQEIAQSWTDRFKDLEISEEYFYKIGKAFHCKNVEFLKKLYEEYRSYPEIVRFFREQGIKTVPTYNVIRGIVRNSFESKEKLEIWKSNIYLEEYQEIARKKGGVCISKRYVNARTPLKFKCKEGHIFEMRPDSVKAGGWCPIGAINKLKLTLEEFQEIARKKGGVCISEQYHNRRTPLKFKCKKGHIFEVTPSHIKEGTWCPVCSEGTSERVCRGIFESIFKKDFKKAKPEWLKNSEGYQLELDGYNDELKLAFERQGEQHYKFPSFFNKTIKEFIIQLSNDQEKSELCDKHGVILIEVPYWIKYSEYQDYIIKQCKAEGIEIPEIEIKIDWKRFEWNIDDDSNRSLREWT